MAPLMEMGETTSKHSLRTDPVVVAQVITRLNVGGPARHALLLTRSLEKRGFHNLLISGSEGLREGRLDPLDPNGSISVPTLHREVSLSDDLRTYFTLRRLFRLRRPAIIHTHMAKAGALGRLAAGAVPESVVLHTFHGHVLESYFGRLKEKAFMASERALARRSDVLVAVAPQTRDQLLDFGIGRPNQWRIVPLGLELESFLTDVPPRRVARIRIGLPESGPIVGIVGRLVKIKDHETFLRAAMEVSLAEPSCTFAVAGDGPLRPELEQLAVSVLPGRVKFLGWVSDLPSLYAALDVVVLTSRNEGTPVALIEAGAAKRPVVATDVGGVSEVVLQGGTGFLAAVGDVSSIARKILILLRDPERSREMGERARVHVVARFSATRLVNEMENLYLELLASRR